MDPVLFRIEAHEQFGQHRYDANQHFFAGLYSIERHHRKRGQVKFAREGSSGKGTGQFETGEEGIGQVGSWIIAGDRSDQRALVPDELEIRPYMNVGRRRQKIAEQNPVLPVPKEILR